jgi:hypothetical protein
LPAALDFAARESALRIRLFFLRGMNRLLDPDLHAFAFLLEAGAKVARAVLEENEEAEGEKEEKNHPE